jgi:hypothetical protein
MYSIALLIVELQSARRRLLKAFEVLNGTPMVRAPTAPYSQRTKIEQPGQQI